MDEVNPKTQVGRTFPRMPLVLGLSTAGLVTALLFLLYRTESLTSKVALNGRAKGVTAIQAKPAKYRPFRTYVGTVAPWLEARIGPQFTSAYVDTVLVRPGAVVQRGQVLATLDCRNASAQSSALALQARALHKTQEAIEKEASRVSGLLSGGYVSENEVERRTAESASKQAELMAAQARLSRAALEVDDCVLKAPFDGEIADRMLDPGAFARPSSAVLSMVDRSQVRVLVDVPETDFQVVAIETPVQIKILATGRNVIGRIARRAPSADPSTRTIHAEIDLIDADGKIPVGTTAELTIAVGEPAVAVEIPLRAASVRGDTASLFVVEQGVAKKRQVDVLGEQGGSLFLAPQISSDALVVLEGRALLSDGESVQAKVVSDTAAQGRKESKK